ncbi:TetR/AcrR family transcriptional regulator [Streptomonospora nanhaiensis]|uniref:AcrR family transcriptional regulator n=1 Tax=Streptomonospora nanhaiensis TaxID=1323731 RepID=A0A853BQG8_9ACTN|nr:TetR/AcrR family transcriptional regulator C-terminal domain-containing protein [Streptomonospora nanhaiensis]MBV2365152.1 TetR/AcrR family transcriptional regulator C-terminal domain-containing protein [Streptomonospora nanhaiensis]MBV2366343.1 TetR/AcrR family transcriptional regulator C-terminal domain-containing protein [Streptomonospora nanhaiensis]MBX9391970.1 TetR/AcrR family transcriptional regulator C-terminal domain-containing protein [Streptomonospora nanhaiensis]NYI97423.1 AcrR f
MAEPEPSSPRRSDSVFTRPPRGRRSQPALTRDRIVAGTIALLDREGSAALTMRRVAAELGVHATSLYWYVARREDLVDLAVDGILAEAAAGLPGPEEPWDLAVRTTARRFYAALTAHAWAAEFAGVRPLLGPNALALSRRIVAALGDSGGGEEAQAVAIRALANQILGAATTTVAMRVGAAAGGGTEDARAAAVSAADALAVENAYFDQVIDLLLAGIRARSAG